ncbi:MAG: hypothetical protein Q7V63_07760 [Gammaproteobacteria bacterium]|nr:hypothetical protein [Gammaproteobacteria bacterium]
MQHKTLWNDRPSLLQNAGSYALAIIAIFLIYHLQLFLGLTPMLWLGNIHLYYFATYWQQQSLLIIDLILDICMAGLFINALFKLLQSMVTRYIVMDDQLMIHLLTPVGMIQERLELYRVTDYEYSESFFGMIFRFGSVILRTNDPARPRMVLTGFRRGQQFLEMLRDETERCRQLKGVREITMPLGSS